MSDPTRVPVKLTEERGLIQLCAEYDAAERNFETNGRPETSAALTKAKADLVRFLQTAQEEVRRFTPSANEVQAGYRQNCLNVLAYFAAWHTLRGGWQW